MSPADGATLDLNNSIHSRRNSATLNWSAPSSTSLVNARTFWAMACDARLLPFRRQISTILHSVSYRRIETPPRRAEWPDTPRRRRPSDDCRRHVCEVTHHEYLREARLPCALSGSVARRPPWLPVIHAVRDWGQRCRFLRDGVTPQGTLI